jgi:hypothetical protein
MQVIFQYAFRDYSHSKILSQCCVPRLAGSRSGLTQQERHGKIGLQPPGLLPRLWGSSWILFYFLGDWMQLNMLPEQGSLKNQNPKKTVENKAQWETILSTPCKSLKNDKAFRQHEVSDYLEISQWMPKYARVWTGCMDLKVRKLSNSNGTYQI